MLIGIHSIAVFKSQKTGVEKYAQELVRNMLMLPNAKEHRFVLYHNDSRLKTKDLRREMQWPDNFSVRFLRSPFLWTQVRLAIHFIFKKPEALFIPAHVLPFIFHPKNSTVMIHDIAYEFFPETYSKFNRNYLRLTTKYALKYAKKIIVPSQSTKDDILKFYKWADDKKISVIHHGVLSSQINADLTQANADKILLYPYFLYVGRLELKKNILGILKAFNLFKAEHKSLHKLVLVGGDGFGSDKIKEVILKYRFRNDIILEGFVSEEEKENLFVDADVLLFPSLYEGFGFPILEAQSYNVPVITSCISSMPEIAGDGAILVDPHNIEEIKDAMMRIITDENLRNNLIQKGQENLKRFSWQACTRKTLDIILK